MSNIKTISDCKVVEVTTEYIDVELKNSNTLERIRSLNPEYISDLKVGNIIDVDYFVVTIFGKTVNQIKEYRIR